MPTIECNKGALAFFLTVVVLALLYNFYGSRPADTKVRAMEKGDVSTSPAQTPDEDGKKTEKMPGYERKTEKTTDTWFTSSKFVNLPTLDLSAIELNDRTQIVEYESKVTSVRILTSPVGASKGDLLLLHGMSYTADTWNGSDSQSGPPLLTIKTMAALGYRTVAVDLPGFGKSPKADVHKFAEFIAQLVKSLGLVKPIVVSPSMSGKFSVPFVVNTPELCGGFVPVAPVGTKSFSDAFKTLKVPAMVIYGERDTGAADSTHRLSQIPDSEVFMLKDSHHSAYLGQPAAFHFLLYNFMRSVKP